MPAAVHKQARVGSEDLTCYEAFSLMVEVIGRLLKWHEGPCLGWGCANSDGNVPTPAPTVLRLGQAMRFLTKQDLSCDEAFSLMVEVIRRLLNLH
jgi:hypothetical protein